MNQQDGSGWEFPVRESGDDFVKHVALIDGLPATWSDWIGGLTHSRFCRAAMRTTLQDAPFTQAYWETPALTNDALDRPFEFVLVAATLSQKADPAAFASFFTGGSMVAVFPNLGADAILVCPTELGDQANRNYLLSFVRTGPAAQLDEFWATIGRTIGGRVSDKPVWVNTSGGGVPWVHVRLDDRPKYYTHAEYRTGR